MLGESKVFMRISDCMGGQIPWPPCCTRVSYGFPLLPVSSALFLPSPKIQLLSLWSFTSTPADFNVHIRDPSKNMGAQLTLSSPAVSCSFLPSDTHLCGHVLYLVITATCKTPRPRFRHLIPSLSFPHVFPYHTGFTDHSRSLSLTPLLDNSQMR